MIPSRTHQGRELEQHGVDPVLHVHDIDVRVRARLEVDDDGRLTGTGGGGGHVTHVLDAVDGLLQRNQDRFDQDIGAGAGIRNGDHHGRRRDVGELCDRKGLDPQHPQEQEDDGDDDRQRRSIEDVCEHGFEIPELPWTDLYRPGCGLRRAEPSKEMVGFRREAVAIPRGFFGVPGPLPACETRIPPPSRRREPAGPPRERSCRSPQVPS